MPNTFGLEMVLLFTEMQNSVYAIKIKLFKAFCYELKLCVLQQLDCK